MKLKSLITERKVNELILEEYLNTMLEDVASGAMDADDFSSNMQAAAAGVPKLFNAIFTNFARNLNQLINQDLLPKAQGRKIQNALEKIPEPKEFGDESPEEKADAVADLDKIIDAATQATAQAGNKDAAKELDKLGDKADELEKKVDDGEGGDPDIGEVEPKVKEAVLDLIDATNEKWDAISKATKNKKLKVAMDTMEKVALSEKLLKAILRRLDNKE